MKMTEAEQQWLKARKRHDDAAWKLRDATNALIEIERELASAISALDDAEEALSTGRRALEGG